MYGRSRKEIDSALNGDPALDKMSMDRSMATGLLIGFILKYEWYQLTMLELACIVHNIFPFWPAPHSTHTLLDCLSQLVPGQVGTAGILSFEVCGCVF